jgi:thiamine biosynthesis lipoprotein
MKLDPVTPVLELHIEEAIDLTRGAGMVWSLGIPTKTESPGFAEVSFRAMGCAVRAETESLDPHARTRLGVVEDWFETWEARLSRFRPDSELSRLNSRAGELVSVSPVLWQVLQTAIQAAKISGGLVTPTVLPALEAAGYDRSFGEVALEGDLDDTRSPGVPPWQAIRLEANGRRVQLPPEARLDLGGIGKGWAADRAAARLNALGPSLVEAGGDIAISGPRRGGRGWRIIVADPRHPDLDLAHLSVNAGGVATSGTDYRRWRRSGEWQHHLIDPRTARPADTDVRSATVIAPSLVLAEIASKTVLLLGSREGMDWLERRPGHAGLLVLNDGSRLDSRRLQDYVWKD